MTPPHVDADGYTTCGHCGRRFEPYRTGHRYCCPRCAQHADHRRQAATKTQRAAMTAEKDTICEHP